MSPTPPSSPRVTDASSATIQDDAIAQCTAEERANAAAADAQRIERERVAARDAALALLGPPSARTQYQDQVLKLNIAR